MTGLTSLVAWRSVLDYVRRPLNVVLLVVVPVVIVVVWGGALVDFSKVILGGNGDRAQIEVAAAGWATAALAGLAGFFQVSGSGSADRRLAAARGSSEPIVAGRMTAALGLSLVAGIGGLLALAVRTGINDPVRAGAGTAVIAVIYLALGMLVGTVVRSEMNGALVVTLLWVFDVFFGPALGPGSSVVTRLLPLHFPTLVLIGLSSEHGGTLGDVGWSLTWAIGLVSLAAVRLQITTRPSTHAIARNGGMATDVMPMPIPRSVAPAGASFASDSTRPVAPTPRATLGTKRPGTAERLTAVIRAGMREHRRNRVLWALLIAVPAVFIGMAVMVTVDSPGPIELIERSRHFVAFLSERRIHAATMVPITAAFLAGITGLFVVTESSGGDRRLVLAGFRSREVLAGRLCVIGVAATLTTLVAVAVSGILYPPRQWVVFIAANLLIAVTYAMIGVLVGPITGRLGGLYLILMLAFIDVGLGQSVMFPNGPPSWGAYLPARGASQMMIDGAFTNSFDATLSMAVGLVWLAALSAAAVAMFHVRASAATGAAQQRAPIAVA